MLYLSISPVHPVHPATPAGLLVAAPSRPPAPGPPVAGAPAPAGRRAVPGEGVPHPVEMWLQGIINGHIFLLLAIEAHLELLVTNAVPQRKMATAMAARSPLPPELDLCDMACSGRGCSSRWRAARTCSGRGCSSSGPGGWGSQRPAALRQHRSWLLRERREGMEKRERKKNTAENGLRLRQT